METRVSFWRKCHEQLQADSADPESASRFFLSQAETGGGDSAGGGDLLDVQERCLLLCLAARWLSLLSPPPVDRLESLEKKLWTSRVRQHALALAMERESVFSLPPPAITPEMDTYESLMKELSLSNVSGLNTETCLSLEGLPGPSEEQQELTAEEGRILTVLIGQLLDEGSVHEASRACRYFSLHHPDVWLVLRCRGLASGDLNPEAPEEASEALPGKSIPSCKLRPHLQFTARHQ